MKYIYSLFLCSLFIFAACKSSEAPTQKESSGYQGQGVNPIVPTATLPIQKQWKGTWEFEETKTYFTNEFDGARLNGVAHDSTNHYTIWITAENTPINSSPWYAFKVWADTAKTVTIKFTYQDLRSRYYPKISRDGVHFQPLDSTLFKPINEGEDDFGINAVPEMIEITVPIDKNPTWISAQELYPSKRVKTWVDSVATNTFAKTYAIGKSREKRPLHLLEIGNANAKKALLIITRQHPPEVTGFLAMKAFIERLCTNDKAAQQFRDEFVVFNVPLVNPDGVDNGHWRHNAGGIDLNRDWENFNQPETQAVRDFLKQKSAEGFEFVFAVDFHSTWDDIYYPISSSFTGDDGKIVYDWIENMSCRLQQHQTNVKPSSRLRPTMVGRDYFYAAHKIPAIVFELGDNTPRPFLKEKGHVAAEELMKLLSVKYK